MTKKPDPIDAHVGKNIRIFRIAKGMSQGRLGDELGVSFQQVQKYEKGANRVGSSRLAQISRILGVPVNRFFDDGADGTRVVAPGENITDLLSEPHAIRMLRALAAVKDIKTRLAFVALMESVPKHKT